MFWPFQLFCDIYSIDGTAWYRELIIIVGPLQAAFGIWVNTRGHSSMPLLCSIRNYRKFMESWMFYYPSFLKRSCSTIQWYSTTFCSISCTAIVPPQQIFIPQSYGYQSGCTHPPWNSRDDGLLDDFGRSSCNYSLKSISADGPAIRGSRRLMTWI